jgi:hypothetical protein
LTATPAAPAVDEDFVTAMQIRRTEPVARIEPVTATNAFGVRITSGNDVHVVLFRRRDAKGVMAGGDLESDGTVASVHYDARTGSVRNAFAASATGLHFRGTEHFRNTTPTDWSLPRR